MFISAKLGEICTLIENKDLTSEAQQTLRVFNISREEKKHDFKRKDPKTSYMHGNIKNHLCFYFIL